MLLACLLDARYPSSGRAERHIAVGKGTPFAFSRVIASMKNNKNIPAHFRTLFFVALRQRPIQPGVCRRGSTRRESNPRSAQEMLDSIHDGIALCTAVNDKYKSKHTPEATLQANDTIFCRKKHGKKAANLKSSQLSVGRKRICVFRKV